MKKLFSIICGTLIAAAVAAQSDVSAPMSFHIEKSVIPPMLELVSGSLKFSDDNGNSLINANEKCYISMKICNKGKGDAYACKANIQATGSVNGLSFADKSLPTIHPNETIDVTLPIQASMETVSGKVNFVVNVSEPNGFGTNPAQISVDTRKFEAPRVEIVSYRIMSNNNDGKLHKKELFRVQALLQNTDVGVAKDVRLNFDAPANMFIVAGENHQIFPSLQPNEQKLIEFEFQTNANVADELDLEIRLAESYGRYAQNAHIPLRFGQAVSTGMTSLHIQGKAEPTVSITRGSLVSDIDENIPTAKKSDDDTYVLIIANENYKYVPNNPFALHDGQVFRQYCEQALGITGKNHINTCFDATLGDMMKGLRWLSDRMETNDKARAIVYYNGHGIPDEATRSAYLLPQDGENAMTRTAYSLDSLYSELGRMNRPVTVFLDACFSGSKRDGGSIGQAKAVAVVPKAGTPQGKTVVFSAATGDQTAGFFYEQQHGMFTYWLLKNLQQNANCSYDQLFQALLQQVGKSSLDENNKRQTPTIQNGKDAQDWQQWKLK